MTRFNWQTLFLWNQINFIILNNNFLTFSICDSNSAIGSLDLSRINDHKSENGTKEFS